MDKKWLWIGGGVAVAALLLSRKASAAAAPALPQTTPTTPDGKPKEIAANAIPAASGPVSVNAESSGPTAAQNLLPQGGGSGSRQSPPVGAAGQAVPASVQEAATMASVNREIPKTEVSAPNALPRVISARSMVPIPTIRTPMRYFARIPSPIVRTGLNTGGTSVTLPENI